MKPPGLAEVVALDDRGAPIAPTDAAANRRRAITMPCGRGPIVAIAGQFLQTSVHTTVGALLDGEPIAAQPCQTAPLQLPAGQQELLISPGPDFTVIGARLAGPLPSVWVNDTLSREEGPLCCCRCPQLFSSQRARPAGRRRCPRP